MTIGERIQTARKKAGMKQADLAEALGVAVVTIGQYERDKRQPRLEQFKAIASALDVDVNWLMNGQTMEERKQGMPDSVARRFKEAQDWKESSDRGKLNAAFDQLNAAGQQKAVERVEELTEIPKYQREKPQDAPIAPSEGKATPPESPTEGPQESK